MRTKKISGLAQGIAIDKAIREALAQVPASNDPRSYIVKEIRVGTGGVVGPTTTVTLQLKP
jgi:hypothetical protein